MLFRPDQGRYLDRLTQVDTLMSFVGTAHPKRGKA
jgi:hypothetical protein